MVIEAFLAVLLDGNTDYFSNVVPLYRASSVLSFNFASCALLFAGVGLLIWIRTIQVET
jgi:hypothetical protein